MIDPKSIDSFWSKVMRRSAAECWETTIAKDRDGYGKTHYKIVGQPGYKFTGAHRFVSMITTGLTIPAGLVVMHKCDNPGCVNPDHLQVGTVQENNQDKLLKGRARAPRGEQQARASISDSTARLIRSEAVVGWRVGYNNGSNITQVAKKYGVPKELVRRIARGELYRHV